MADFTLTPDVVTPLEPEFNEQINVSDGLNKTYLLLGGPILKYKLYWGQMSSSDVATFMTHVNSHGWHYAFDWTGVPTYVNSGSNINGRWVKGSYICEPLVEVPGRWHVEITIEGS